MATIDPNDPAAQTEYLRQAARARNARMVTAVATGQPVQTGGDKVCDDLYLDDAEEPAPPEPLTSPAKRSP